MRPNPIAALVATDLAARKPAPPRRKRRVKAPKEAAPAAQPLRLKRSDPLPARR